MKKAVILLSGGLDSVTLAAIAKQDHELYGLTFKYGQKHDIEISFAQKNAKIMNFKEHHLIELNNQIFSSSSLVNKDIAIPINRKNINKNISIPSTYVPARNIIFLSYATAYAENIGAENIFIGVNAVDYSGYPDCREEFIKSFEYAANLGITKKIKIKMPLISLGKNEIIAIGSKLGVDYSFTHSCYNPISQDNKTFACGVCDSCILRLNGFNKNNLHDPCRYFQK
jgi:7-cyano-7-deazaguanine synthase